MAIMKGTFCRIVDRLIEVQDDDMDAFKNDVVFLLETNLGDDFEYTAVFIELMRAGHNEMLIQNPDLPYTIIKTSDELYDFLRSIY